MNIPIINNTDTKYIYVSYAYEDREAALQVSTKLSKEGYHLYLYSKSTEQKKKEEMLMHCKLFLCLLSSNYLRSPECMKELETAKENNIPSLIVSLHAAGEPLEVKDSLLDQWIRENTIDTDIFTSIQKHGILKYKNPYPDIRSSSILRFGRYKQDNFILPIKWRVLEIRGDNALLISEFALDCQRYHTFYEDITWEKCSLRQWLNNDFFYLAFNETEKATISPAFLVAEDNKRYNTLAGYDTIDCVFLLSLSEAEEYFQNDEERKCVPTQYALEQGVYRGAGHCWWWLRSPGCNPNRAADVHVGGSLNPHGIYVDNDNDALRQSLWINLQSEIFKSGIIHA